VGMDYCLPSPRSLGEIILSESYACLPQALTCRGSQAPKSSPTCNAFAVGEVPRGLCVRRLDVSFLLVGCTQCRRGTLGPSEWVGHHY
jgi:hypothetical protein